MILECLQGLLVPATPAKARQAWASAVGSDAPSPDLQTASGIMGSMGVWVTDCTLLLTLVVGERAGRECFCRGAARATTRVGVMQYRNTDEVHCS